VTLISAALRSLVVERAGNRCEYCRLAQESQIATFPVDHVTPVTLEGRTLLDNLALACPRCNAAKWLYVEAADPVSGQRLPIFNPRTQVWTEHFRWSEVDPAILEPLTPSARATVALLDLNSQQHLAIRRLLLALRMHPPS
jgi:hypothetical protein